MWLASPCLALLGACSGSGTSGTSNSTLSVTPATGLTGSGAQGGPFTPITQDYTLTNIGTDPLTWSATSIPQAAWLVISNVGGTLLPAEQVVVTVSIDASSSAILAAGVHAEVVDFDNLSNASGSTSRQVALSVATAPGLAVSPPEDFTPMGSVGGPFSPLSKTYTLLNTSANTLNWSASVPGSFLQLSVSSGTLLSGASFDVDVTVDVGVANGLSLGAHSSIVEFANDSTGAGTTGRGVTVTANALAAGATAASLTQFGITWSFDQPYSVGQFANGDWWVVGPVTIIGISPLSTKASGRTKHGSMINPSPRDGLKQGYDSTMYAQYRTSGDYDPMMNVALDVSGTNPLAVQPHSSLVSTISRGNPDQRPQLKGAAILTVLPSAPPAGSFRPPYSGSDKTILHTKDDLDYTKLASLAPVASTPQLAAVARMFERPWIDHVPDWPSRYIHPLDNMREYGREFTDEVSWASLMLHLNFTNAQKETLLIRFVQLGIDWYGVLRDGGQRNWDRSSTHSMGRKWPMLFAGLMLNDPNMSGIGVDPNLQNLISEDSMMFYVEETKPGVFNFGFGGYGPQLLGVAEWGSRHWVDPSKDNASWLGDPYRTCCTAHVLWGEALAAYIMGAKPLWNHDSFFDYMDRYLSEMRLLGNQVVGWQISWTDFQIDMWDAYRNDY